MNYKKNAYYFLTPKYILFPDGRAHFHWTNHPGDGKAVKDWKDPAYEPFSKVPQKVVLCKYCRGADAGPYCRSPSAS